jgi:anti-sigma factor RsiW
MDRRMNRRWRFWRTRPAALPGALTCHELVDLVTDYVEGALDDGERARFEAHIGPCRDCAAYVEQMGDTIRLMGEIEPGGLAPEIERQLLAAFRDWKADGA